MCGICGVINAAPDRQIDRDRLTSMTMALEHRGPDDFGEWTNGRAGMAMRRLSVIDLFRGHQPMINEDRSLILVFNGEIYNYRDLRSALEEKGHTFRTLSDTEVILRAYEEWGDNCLHHFNGMFAFALYDAELDRLLLARDRVGIKPLFYTVKDGTIAFASELDSLLQSGKVSGRLNPSAIDAYFTFLYVPAPDTIFRGVHKLRPGEKLVYERGELRRERYWRLPAHIDESWTLESASEQFIELFSDALQMQCISDVPLGAFLSGGMDSSSVVGMLSLLSDTPIKTFSIGFDDPDANELEFARIVAKHFGTEHTEEIVKPELMFEEGDFAVRFGEPFADSSAVPTWLVSRLAKHQVTVALSGDGGDELLAGYTWMHMTRRVREYSRIPKPVRAAIHTGLRMMPRRPRYEKLRRFSGDSFRGELSAFRRRHTCLEQTVRTRLYAPELIEGVAAAEIDRFNEHAKDLAHLGPDDRMLHLDFLMYLPDDILTKVDRMSMAHGLEARVPLLDHRIVEFAASLPFHLKYNKGRSKVLLKHALRDLLPPELTRQRKRGFAVPIHRWMRGSLLPQFEEYVLGDSSRCGVFLQRPAIRHLLEQHVQLRENHGHALWAIFMFEQWLRYAESVPGVTLSL